MPDLKQSVRSRQSPTGPKYLYGVINCGSSRPLQLVGIDDAVVYCWPYKSIGAAVSDIECVESQQDIVAIDRHGRVAESLMDQFSILPARFGTILSDPQQIDDLLRENYDSFCRDLRRLENKVQFDLKVLWPAGSLREAIEENELSLAVPARAEATDTPSARYSLYKRRERTILQIMECKAAAHADAIERSLLCICNESRCEVLPAEEMMLSSAYLIERTRSAELHRAIGVLQSNSPEFNFLLTGPWPPYSFMNIQERILKCEVV